MRKIVTSILMVFIFIRTFAQVFSVNAGQIFYNSKTVTPVIGQYEEYTNRNVFLIGYQHHIQRNWNIFCNFSQFDGWTDFSINRPYEPALGASWAGSGASYTRVQKYGLGLGYDFLRKQRFYLSPIFAIQIQRATATNDAEILEVIDNRTDKEIQGVLFNSPHDNIQVLPEFGLKFGMLFFNRLDIGVSSSYALGHKSFQDLTFNYSPKGIQQPMAKWYSDGTAFFFHAGNRIPVI
jgi:hypothetical protein